MPARSYATGLRLLEENESRTLDLQNAVAEGFDSGYSRKVSIPSGICSI